MPDSPSPYNASGIWSLNDVEEAVQGSNWANRFPVIKDGLQLYLDAGDTSSYPVGMHQPVEDNESWHNLMTEIRNFQFSVPMEID